MFVLTEEGGSGRSGLHLVGVSVNVTSAEWWRHERSAEDFRVGDTASAFSERCVEGVRAFVRRQKAILDPGAHEHDRETRERARRPDLQHCAQQQGTVPAGGGAEERAPKRLRETCQPRVHRGGTGAEMRRPRGHTRRADQCRVCELPTRSLPRYDRVMVPLRRDKTG